MADTYPELETLVVDISAALIAKNEMLVTAESCTGGLIGKLITDRAGSSAVIERGFITYSNESKIEMLGVDKTLIENNGAVSGEVAAAMAGGALKYSKAHYAVAVTGIAGPGGGSAEKPVGLVYIAVASQTSTICRHYIFNGTREDVRLQSAKAALTQLKELL